MAEALAPRRGQQVDVEVRGEAVEVDGQMVDYPVVYRARALLETMREIAAKGG